VHFASGVLPIAYQQAMHRIKTIAALPNCQHDHSKFPGKRNSRLRAA
jgi:hypothetical protein